MNEAPATTTAQDEAEQTLARAAARPRDLPLKFRAQVISEAVPV